jgi:Flp pilus assembly protein TadD
MMRHVPLMGLLLVLAACSTAPSRHELIVQSPLLDGQELFGMTVPVAEEADILAVSDEMRAFVDAHGGDVQVDWLRMKRLLAGLQSAGYLNLTYENDKTLTASETFERRSGNCLSFTNLFVALARASSLAADFQVVDVPPTWDSLDGWVILNSHIDVILQGLRMGAPGGGVFRRDFVVDFNMADFQTAYPRRVVKDRTAFALFYNNRGVEAMRAGDLRSAFANLKLAIAKDPTVASAWVNLGALYSRQRRFDFAQAAYQRALEVQPSDKSALTNLARLNDELGNSEAAAAYRQRVRHYEDLNPYYHYALAENAYRVGDDAGALAEIKKAIALKNDDHRLYFLEGLIHYRRGDVSDARSSIAMAERLSDEDVVKQRYASKLAALGLKNG